MGWANLSRGSACTILCVGAAAGDWLWEALKLYYVLDTIHLYEPNVVFQVLLFIHSRGTFQIARYECPTDHSGNGQETAIKTL